MTLNTGDIPQTDPQVSPFSSPIVELMFKDSAGVPLTVHHAYLDGRSGLLATMTRPRYAAPVCSLRDVSIDAGHILVNWLYTGIYQPLDKITSPQAALKTAFGVYSLSRRYELPDLEWRATVRISRLQTEVEIPSLLDIIEESYPQTIGEDTWMASFLEEYIKDTMEHVKTAPLAHDPKAGTENVSITKLIVKSLLGACGEAMRDVAAREAALAEGSSESNPGASMKEERATPRKEKRHQGSKLGHLPSLFGPPAKQSASTEAETTLPDNNDWVMPSPQSSGQLEAQPELVDKVKKPKKPKKKKEPIVAPEPEPEIALPQDPEPEAALPQDAEPEAAPPQDAEPEASLLHDAEPEAALQYDLDPEAALPQDTDLAEENVEVSVWGQSSQDPPETSPVKREKKASKSKESKPKKKKKVAPVAELEQVLETEMEQLPEYMPEQDLEPALEPEPVLEQGFEPGPAHVALEDSALWRIESAAPVKVKKPKKKKKEKMVVAEVPEETRVEEEVAIFTPVHDWDR